VYCNNNHHGIKQDKSQKTGRSGDAALKPYAPTGTKKKGEGDCNNNNNNNNTNMNANVYSAVIMSVTLFI